MARARPIARTTGVRWGRLLALSIAVVGGWLAFEYATLPDVTLLARERPTQSALMQARVAEAKAEGKELKLRHTYVTLEKISPLLQRAVVLGEDAKFWMHDGVDWGETRKAVAEAFAQGRLGRGASTITQQLAKNLYLSNSRSLARKAKEWILADRLEEALTKKRILELYLNFAEWGDGVFGVEAAARLYFSKGAATLDAGEAAVLTAMLPSPRKRDPRAPSKNLQIRAYKIAGLLADVGLTPRDVVRARVGRLVGAAPKKTSSKPK